MFCQKIHQVRNAVAKDIDHSTLAICFMAALCAILPLDISQLSFAILGAALYAVLCKANPNSPKKAKSSLASKCAQPKIDTRVLSKPKSQVHQNVNKNNIADVALRGPGPEIRKPSSQPVAAPSFQSQGWEEEICELLTQIAPSTEVEDVVKKLVHTMRCSIEKIIPEVEITGFANGSLNVGKAFGVAVPEVDIVISAQLDTLFRRLYGRRPQNEAELDINKLQKSALRMCTDRLVSMGGFKFRRSAFRGSEPKVTLLVPPSLGLFADSFPVDFSVNVVTPFYNATLLKECGQIDTRAKELILLVRRWAKDRGVSHSAKGHLSPYIWSLMSIYFLQVRVNDDEGSILPPLEDFDISAKSEIDELRQSKVSVGALFKEFAGFFSTQFDWSSEAVSVRLGKRAPPRSDVPLHILDASNASPQVGPTIEDPFQKGHNLGDSMTETSFTRLREELSRACELCARSASLSELLEPWAPTEVEEGEPSRDDAQHTGDKASRAQLQKKTQGEDWRRDATHAQKPSATTIPPWRRQKQAQL